MLIDKIRGSKLYQEKLSHTKLVAFLKKCKRGLGKLKMKIRVLLKLQERFPRLLPILEETLYTTEDMPDLVQLAKEVQGEEPVDIIVPIYNGYEYLVRLFEDLPKAGMPCRFILVDDKSPEERVHALEREFVDKHENAILLENEVNVGFVGSVNKGLREAKGHVALVNTDTELPEGWLVRLMYPIIKGEKIATTTPFSNSATIFSFPNFCYNNPIYRDLSVETLDTYFRQAKCKLVEAPTGVGFCMGMNKEAIEAVGLLDEEAFGRGYCEENDWCQRAVKAGYKNVQVENLFVYHKHGGSFLSEEKQKLIDDHLRILRRRFPDYEPQVSAFIRKDENGNLRRVIEMIIDTHETKSVLYFNHSLGGGATSYMEQQKARMIKEGACVTVIFFDPQIQSWTMFFENHRGVLKYENWSMEELLQVGKYLHFDEIIINQLVLFPYLQQMQETIIKLHELQKDSKLIMLCHDLFAICPSINLVSEDMRYCGMPCKEDCDKCFLEKRFVKDFQCPDRQEWNKRWAYFLQHCTEVRTFSQDTLDRMKAVYGEDLAYTLVPHEVKYAFPIAKETKTTDTLNIGILGVLTVHKGGVLVSQMLDVIEREKLPIRIKLIGRCENLSLKDHPAFLQTGTYSVEDLPSLIYENDIDMFFISSVWPETFSYTTDEVMKMGLPIAALDIGAPAERVAKYERGLLIQANQGENVTCIPAEEIVRRIQSFAEKLELTKQTCAPKKVLYIAEDYSFTTRYRLQHLKDELLFQGVKGELTITATLPKNVDWDTVASVVVYRCKKQDRLEQFLAEAKRHGVTLIYDMDDYIFDYPAISDLPFLQDEEYKDFESYSNSLRGCMELCDKYIVSTNHMKQAVEMTFPGKPVFINRNMASTQMLILSAKAKLNKRMDERFVLGYYSGSHTHNRDFELISEVLLGFLKKHKNAYLQLVGCLVLPKEFAQVEDQIIRYDFMDWKKLPETMAELDVNLMPLEDSFFHRCKSENKWMEAALVGVPTIGSFNEELEGATKNHENVILCKDVSEWQEELEKLYENAAYRQAIGEAAYQYALANKTTLCKNPALKEYVLGQEDPFFTVIVEKKTDCLANQTFKSFETLFGREQVEQAKGAYILFLSGEEVLQPTFLSEYSKVLGTGAYDLVYCDEELAGESFYKPGWSPDLALEWNYVGTCAAFETILAKNVIRQQDKIEDRELWAMDFLLRYTEVCEKTRIGHVEQLLCSSEKMTGANPELDVMKKEALLRRGVQASLEKVEELGVSRVVYEAPQDSLVSIVIPSKDHPELLEKCLESITKNTPAGTYEIVVVDNGSSEEKKAQCENLVAQYQGVYHYEPMEFNFAKMCNIGATLAKGQYLLFLNDDVLVQGAGWLRRMLGQASQKHTGAVGAKLLYPEGNKIQHTGVALLGKNPSHVLVGTEDSKSYYFGRNRLTYNYLAVTAACMMLSKERFEQVGGFEEKLPVSYNDVELCMKLQKAGFVQVVRNDVNLIHCESASRGLDVLDDSKNARMLAERSKIQELHPEFFADGDPYYNSNLSTEYTDFRKEENGLPQTYSREVGYIENTSFVEAPFQGYIDSVEKKAGTLEVKGWYFYKSAFWMKHSKVYVVLKAVDKQAIYYETTALNRADVAEKLNLSVTKLGFGSRINLDTLEPATSYRVGLFLKIPLTGKKKLLWKEELLNL